MSKVTLNTLNAYKKTGEKFAVLTAYDATFANVISNAGVEVILVGDSLGMVLQGHDSTLAVSMDDMTYHTRCVAAGNEGALIMADLPFMSYATPEQTMTNSAALMQAGANMVKLEGGAWLEQSIAMLDERGIPSCVHLGLTPQAVNKFGGYKVQGRDEASSERLYNDALLLEQAGASIILLECVPSKVAKRISQNVGIPVIGIGAGPDTDAQVLVMQDMLNIPAGKKAKFVKNYMAQASDIAEAFSHYVEEVKNGSFPSEEHSFK
ncbi:MAG: 3-methyl-2-oxobutanoate hydroxymethyltransferase [Oceanospirillaceae bacterium]|nr:3-methyl-2-oxobutanoate hydroxymethyltransferase [Oceanospirillaceae bacterium]